jgi:hypothetical protein
VLIPDMDGEHVRRTAKIVASELQVAGSWALWAAVMQGLVMQKDFRGGNIPIVGGLETGLGRCQWNLEQLSREFYPGSRTHYRTFPERNAYTC